MDLHTTVPNGETVTYDRRIANLKWNMVHGEFQVQMYVIPLGGYDAVLGVQWMKTVSPIIFDFQNRKVIIHWKGKQVTLGDHVDSKQYYSVQVEDKFHWNPQEETYFLV